MRRVALETTADIIHNAVLVRRVFGDFLNVFMAAITDKRREILCIDCYMYIAGLIETGIHERQRAVKDFWIREAEQPASSPAPDVIAGP